MQIGTIKFYDEQKKFGFISRVGKDDIFFHVTGCIPGYEPTKDEPVTFDIGEGKKGPMAVKVEMQIATSQ